MQNCFRKYLLIIILAVASFALPAKASAQRLDFFMGVDFNYRRLFYNDRLYDLLIHLTPGMKFQFGDGWQIAAQALVPVVNQYGDFYSKLRPGVCSMSKEFLFNDIHSLKFSAGLFSAGRYGIDAKWLWPVCNWFALEAQLGFTGFHSLEQDWEFSKMDRLSGNLKARFYIEKAASEIRLSAGRYAYADYGGRMEFLTNFNFTTVGLFAQYGNGSQWGAGAKVIFMLPWQDGAGGKKVRFRPASNFRLTYDVKVNSYALRNYMTDPEENERTGNFSKSKWPLQ